MKPIPILRHVPHEPAGTVEDALARAGLEFRYIDLFRNVPDTLDLEGIPGMVVMGGPMNVDQTDRYPFLAAECFWIAEAVGRGIPLLGICLGSQLLAKAMGARVYPLRQLSAASAAPLTTPVAKEIGWYTIELMPEAAEDPLFGECFPRLMGTPGPNGPDPQIPALTVFQWHGDTFDLPPGAVWLAKSAACPHQAFRCGPAAWGLQFHIEVTAKILDDWFAEPGNCEELAGVPSIRPEAICSQTPQELPRLNALAAEVLGRFAARCR